VPRLPLLKLLVEDELELEDSTDTLGRWMSHRVAELIHAGAEDESARTEAADLILRVWERRSAWPQGWPPPESLAVLEALTPRGRRAPQETPEEAGPWLERLPALWALHQEESDIWRDLALMGLPARPLSRHVRPRLLLGQQRFF